MTDVTQVFLKEVDDALHEERLLAVWKTYKTPILGAVTLLVLAVAAWQGYTSYTQRQADKVAETWDSLATQTDETRAVALNRLAAEGSIGFRSLARMELAKTGGPPVASTHYDAVARDADAPAWLADMARFDRALVSLKTDPAAAKADLETLVTGDTSALRLPALELLALLAMQEGDTPKARDLTQQILNEPNLPGELRQRAALRLGALSTLAR